MDPSGGGAGAGPAAEEVARSERKGRPQVEVAESATGSRAAAERRKLSAASSSVSISQEALGNVRTVVAMSVAPYLPLPPILGALETVTDVLAEVAGCEPGYLRTRDKEAALRQLQQAEAQLAGLRLRVTAEAADVAQDTGAPSVAAWERTERHADLSAARRREHLARDLTRTWTATGDALTRGAITLAQASVVRAALRDLPDDLEPALLSKAESTLLDYAGHHTPRELRILGKKILEVIAPDTHDRDEARVLAREEAAAGKGRSYGSPTAATAPTTSTPGSRRPSGTG